MLHCGVSKKKKSKKIKLLNLCLHLQLWYYDKIWKQKKNNQVKETQEITTSPLAECRMDLGVFKFRYTINVVSQDHCVEFFLLQEEQHSGIEFRPDFHLMCYNCHGTSKILRFQINPYLGLSNAVDFSENKLRLAFLQVHLNIYQSDHDWTYEESHSPVTPQIWPYWHLQWLVIYTNDALPWKGSLGNGSA